MPTYALHETLEVHEMATFKTVCLTKSKLMQPLVSDPALQEILRQDVQTGTRQLQELGDLLAKAMH
ncbi:hypothetical protein J31TS4_18280 [Paenibacillus sp. J31TS4]|uniref:hypothetical protein n=1 Tax=Paenibacillus sp. J31TS4 TaxID=2807195 RepID=UPI001B1820FF|nr:hypothetical protein [Paenibacillus sp. J31TS4]GIP38548.1 hypothetical protein J31TS4_18280 [Paenibacillus sp. J31TS4]